MSVDICLKNVLSVQYARSAPFIDWDGYSPEDNFVTGEYWFNLVYSIIL